MSSFSRMAFDAEETLDRLLTQLSVNVGPLNRLNLFLAGPDFPRLFSATSVAHGLDMDQAMTLRRFDGAGHGLTRAHALIGALGETIERLASTLGSAAMKQPERVRFAKYAELPQEQVLPLADYQLFRAEQVANSSLRLLPANETLPWVRGSDLANSSVKMWYPECFLTRSKAKSLDFDFANSNGFALGSSLEQATYASICETMERDAFCDMWWNRTTMPRYRLRDLLNHVDPKLALAIDSLANQISVIDHGAHWGVPVFTVVNSGSIDRNEPPILVSSACDLHPLRALEKALLEHIRIYASVADRSEAARSAQPTAPFERSIFSFEDVFRSLWCPHVVSACDFILSSPFQTDTKALTDQTMDQTISYSDALGELARRILAKGKRCYVFDLTPADLRAVGLYLVRVKIPEAIPLNAAHIARPFGCMGLRQASINDLNPFPNIFI